MKAWTFPFLFFSLASVAQPGDPSFLRFLDPCGIPPNDSIDITNDGIPDLVVQGFRSGTDDEPSSSGNCHLHVMNLPGTTLLSDLDGSGYRRTKVCAKGDTVHVLDTKRRDDLHIPGPAYADGSIPVAYWGYGHQSALVTATPNLEAQYYVFRTVANGTEWHGSFTIEPPVQMDLVNIRVGTLVPSDQLFVVR